MGTVETRAATEADAPSKLGGYAALFNSPATICGYFVEKIAPGAFAGSIAKDDVRALFNHDANYVLGRSINKTLTMSEDAKGLAFEAIPPETSWAKDLMASVARGDISQCSFAFILLREEWDETGDLPVRTILEAQLTDVSIVTYPAYEDTEVGVRSLDKWRAENAGPPSVEQPPLDPSPIASNLRSKLAMRQGLLERGRRA